MFFLNFLIQYFLCFEEKERFALFALIKTSPRLKSYVESVDRQIVDRHPLNRHTVYRQSVDRQFFLTKSVLSDT